MTERQLIGWEKTRAMGPVWFVLVYGVMFWGLLCALAFAGIFPLGVGIVFGDNVTFMEVLPLSLVLFPVGGLVVGTIFWRAAEKDYRKWKDTGVCDDKPGV